MKYLIKILNDGWKFLNSKFFSIVIIILLLFILAGMCQRNSDLDHQNTIHEQNIIALNDSLKLERNKNGELIASIAGYISSEDELRRLNKGLWDRIQDQNGKIISLTNVIIQLKQDTTDLRKFVDHQKTVIDSLKFISENEFYVPWTLAYTYDETNFDLFQGRSLVRITSRDPLEMIHVGSEMLNRNTQIDLTWGQKIEKGQLRIFIQSAYPGFTVSSMEGVLIDPNTNPFFKDQMKKKHWFSGWSIGLGVTYGWDLINQKGAIVIGPSFQWTIYNW